VAVVAVVLPAEPPDVEPAAPPDDEELVVPVVPEPMVVSSAEQADRITREPVPSRTLRRSVFFTGFLAPAKGYKPFVSANTEFGRVNLHGVGHRRQP
jgi:hypothetical protein